MLAAVGGDAGERFALYGGEVAVSGDVRGEDAAGGVRAGGEQSHRTAGRPLFGGGGDAVVQLPEQMRALSENGRRRHRRTDDRQQRTDEEEQAGTDHVLILSRSAG
ncbi:hypothetical protein a10_07223 [Streptomyces acidiscabies]|nr:hypothetical protein a10_07223 [Streptomyces acidiscabies]